MLEPSADADDSVGIQERCLGSRKEDAVDTGSFFFKDLISSFKKCLWLTRIINRSASRSSLPELSGMEIGADFVD
jgi:hypothetical protein